MKQLVIIAAGGLGREAADLVERSEEWDLIGFLDDDPLGGWDEGCGQECARDDQRYSTAIPGPQSLYAPARA